MAALRIRQATIADLDVIERNINAVCNEGIYLVPSYFVMHQQGGPECQTGPQYLLKLQERS